MRNLYQVLKQQLRPRPLELGGLDLHSITGGQDWRGSRRNLAEWKKHSQIRWRRLTGRAHRSSGFTTVTARAMRPRCISISTLHKPSQILNLFDCATPQTSLLKSPTMHDFYSGFRIDFCHGTTPPHRWNPPPSPHILIFTMGPPHPLWNPPERSTYFRLFGRDYFCINLSTPAFRPPTRAPLSPNLPVPSSGFTSLIARAMSSPPTRLQFCWQGAWPPDPPDPPRPSPLTIFLAEFLKSQTGGFSIFGRGIHSPLLPPRPSPDFKGVPSYPKSLSNRDKP